MYVPAICPELSVYRRPRGAATSTSMCLGDVFGRRTTACRFVRWDASIVTPESRFTDCCM